MAKQTINVGSGEFAGDGEALRSAFIKINNNFTELYTADENVPVLTTVTSHIIPASNQTYDLGSTSSQWRSLYVSSATIFIGGKPLTITNSGTLSVNGLEVVPGLDITETDVSNWNTAYGWGDHSSVGYVTSSTETDPKFSTSTAASITATNVSNWNSAYGWGNHANSGYVKNNAVPLSSIGSSGDTAGLVSFDSNYVYYCTGTYNGSSNIWKRVSWSNDTW